MSRRGCYGGPRSRLLPRPRRRRRGSPPGFRRPCVVVKASARRHEGRRRARRRPARAPVHQVALAGTRPPLPPSSSRPRLTEDGFGPPTPPETVKADALRPARRSRRSDQKSRGERRGCPARATSAGLGLSTQVALA